MRIWTGFVGSVVEAWSELRVHRLRVLLSLIGVAVAVAALTGIVALGEIAEQSQKETMERQSGRPALLMVNAFNPTTGQQVTSAAMEDAFDTAMTRYSIAYSSKNFFSNMSVQFPDGVRDVQLQVVEADFGTMHRIQVQEGSWFVASDDDRLAPAVVINGAWWRLIGSPDLATHPTVTLPGRLGTTTAVVVGVTPSPPAGEYPSMFLLSRAFERISTPEVVAMSSPSFEAWVPPTEARKLSAAIKRDLSGVFDKGTQVQVNRSDYLTWQGDDPFLFIKLLVGGVAGLILLLGALSLVNISLVTVRHRIREIGIRRSFGATAGRVFFAVMMESVVATFVAGVAGVALAVLIVKSPWVTDFVTQGVDDAPAFPASAALLGLVSATFVGALAGLLPALVAVRVKVIDAIRY